MEEMKKGVERTSTPQEGYEYPPNKQVNYNRLVNLCLGLSLIAITIFMVGYIKNSDRAVFLGIGMMFSSLIMHFTIYPIEKEDEE